MPSVRQLATNVGLALPSSCRTLTGRLGVHSLRDAFAAEAIRDFHRHTGGIFGPFGPFAGTIGRNSDGSYTQGFQIGEVNLANLDAPPQGFTEYKAEVTLAAVHCFGTQDPDGSDSPYVVVSLISVDPNGVGTDQLVSTIHTPIQNDVPAGATILKNITLGQAHAFPGSGLNIHVAVWDHESGNVDDITNEIHQALNDAANEGAQALAGAAAAGDPQTTAGTVGDVTQFEIAGVRPFDVLTLGAAKLIAQAFADDLVAEHTFEVPAGNIIDLADPAKFAESLSWTSPLDADVRFNLGDDFLFGGNGSYKVYLTVKGITINEPVDPAIPHL